MAQLSWGGCWWQAVLAGGCPAVSRQLGTCQPALAASAEQHTLWFSVPYPQDRLCQFRLLYLAVLLRLQLFGGASRQEH